MNPLNKNRDKYAVKLNVYDMTSFNQYLDKIGVGVYHSGIEIFGVEYSYGGHPFEFSGIFRLEPKKASEFQTAFIFKESILMGYSNKDKTDFMQILVSLGNNRFRGKKYHLFSNNCNHFTNVLSQLLCSKTIPHWVNRLARISSCVVPLFSRILPQQMFVPTITMVPKDIYENIKEYERNLKY